MNALLLHPTDVLFFRDGRPMGGSLGGHGAAWPLPTVTNAALHAALHRAELEKTVGGKLHGHDHHRHDGQRVTDVRKFGSLVTAGPFPVKDGVWLFPRPLDAGLDKDENESTQPTLLPLAKDFTSAHSSLPKPLSYPVANNHGPTKETLSPWWNAAAWESYLGTGTGKPACHKDADFSDTEFSYGIGIDAATGTQDGERFYSAHYLRLKPHARLGLLAEAHDKIDDNPKNKRDLIPALFPNSGTQTPVIVGGQQRLCTVEAHHQAAVPLPKGKTADFSRSQDSKGHDLWLVKWVLLSPAIFPGIGDHTGGWLPTWINQSSGQVELLDGPGKNAAARRRVPEGKPIPATLVAALIGKSIPVTGYTVPHRDVEDIKSGAKPTHLAVPAGSVYYFTCASEDGAQKLASALNWHGKDDFTTIKNRRSTLMGEKGFGLGVCGTWQFHSGNLPPS